MKWDDSIKGWNTAHYWVDEVQSYVVNDASYSPDGSSLAVWDEQKKAWKVLPIQGVKINNLNTDTEWVTDWVNDKLQKSFVNPLPASVSDSDGYTTWGDYSLDAVMENMKTAYLKMSGSSSQFSQVLKEVYAGMVTPEETENSKLIRLFPALKAVSWDEGCPSEGCVYPEFLKVPGCICDKCQNKENPWAALEEKQRVVYQTLNQWIIHLNDRHRWPRTQKDREARFLRGDPYITSVDGPSIYEWLKEGVEKYGWDLSCTLPTTGEEY